MGDAEVSHLLEHNELPNTQPFQAIIQGEPGREYSEKYLKGLKKVDSSPSTVVEFVAEKRMIDELFQHFHKPEDGVLSCGLGDKAGGQRNKFNDSLRSGSTHWRIVTVKRGIKKKKRKKNSKKNKKKTTDNSTNDMKQQQQQQQQQQYYYHPRLRRGIRRLVPRCRNQNSRGSTWYSIFSRIAFLCIRLSIPAFRNKG
mmetsp:Transcript_4351/g.7926  ORF Transcript_4351/g.7926 Transcript_4351/m.7926 type:complete len:198 (+) Transcript_4351:444-1037(+)